MDEKESIVCIGLPVYNGGKFLKNTLDSLLSQTLTNFDLIISDNASTDETQNICQEYAKNDKRIQYYRQPKNIGVISNHKFVLAKSKQKYFQWVAADDLWHNTFLEKNIKVLENNEKLVGSISEVKIGYNLQDDWKSIVENIQPKNFTKGSHVQPLRGTHSDRIKILLTLREESALYSVYRTEILKKCVNVDELYVWAFQILFQIAKFGETNVLDDVLMYKYEYGETGVSSALSYIRKQKLPLKYVIFPHLHFTIWCTKNLGANNVFKNFPLLLRYFLQGQLQLLIDLYKK
jgi:glycosyltransferase involved in cell wall biosynthesis